MIKDAKDIISNATRATLFGRFYEKIIRKWLESKLDFEVYEGKPRIYWKEQPLPSIPPNSTDRMSRLDEIFKNAKQSKSHCTPDGLLKRDGKYFIWEAKNWPKWREPIDNVLWNSPWLLARKVDYRKEKLDLDGILFFWWERPQNEHQLLNEIRCCISPLSFDIYYTSEILNECVKEQPEWYRTIIKQERSAIDKFFAELLGEE